MTFLSRNRLLLLLLASFIFHRAEGWVRSSNCDLYGADIHDGMSDAFSQLKLASRTMKMESYLGADLFGLKGVLFPNIDNDDEARANLTFIYGQSISQRNEWQYGDIQEAPDNERIHDITIADRLWEKARDVREQDPAALQQIAALEQASNFLMSAKPLISTIYFSCNASTFSREEDQDLWWDSDTQQLYSSPANHQICAPGYKTMTATGVNSDSPYYLVVVLCPSLLTQTIGEPKMYLNLAGADLTNTRPNFDAPLGTVLTATDTLDLFAWTGMSIDQLRERVLSVFLARIVIFAIAAKYWDRTHVRSLSPYRTFAQTRGLSLYSAVGNVDVLSMYATGAALFFNELIPAYESADEGGMESPSSEEEEEDLELNLFMRTHWWDANGVLQDRSVEAVGSSTRSVGN